MSGAAGGNARRELFRRMLADHGLAVPDDRARSRREPGTPAPLSFGQQRLWFLDQLNPHNAFYSIHNALRLDFPLDPRCLERALNEIVRRHDALRTTFQSIDGQPVQVVAPSLDFELAVIDLYPLGAAAEARALEIATEEARRPFDLTTGPLLRATAIRLAPARWILSVTIHHIISDGWSMRVMFKEMATLYEAFASGRPSPLPPLPIQYPDVATWQRETLTHERLVRQLDYWSGQLADLPTLELLTDRPRPPVQSFAGATRAFTIGPEVIVPLRQLCAAAGATLFMGLLTGFSTLLSRYTGQSDLPIGTYIAGRNRSEFEPLIGFFVNTLVMRIDLSGNPSFQEAFNRVRAVALDAYGHQDVPFEMLVEKLDPPRDPSRNPLVQVAFQLFGADAGTSSSDGPAAETLLVERGAAVFDLIVSGWEDSDGAVQGKIEYSTELFDATTVDRWMDQLARLMAAAVSSPNRALSELSMVSDDDRAQLREWNATSAPVPAASLAELFAAQVIRTPDAPAIFSDFCAPLSYAEFDRASTHLAHSLLARGVGPESIVGLYCERSPELLIGLIAILKAGAAYLPLDPAYPRDRLAMILADARPVLLLTQRRLRAALPETKSPVLCFEDADLETECSQFEPFAAVDPLQLAYVIYTSGSTGTPKGAMNTLGAIVNRLHWMQQRYRLTADDRVMQKTPISFDVSVWELLWPLLTGAGMVLVRPGGHADPRYIADAIRRHGVTTIHFVPSMLQEFLREPGVMSCGSLRRVICSGEALPKGLQDQFFAKFPGVDLHNLYGPTEAAIDVTAWQCQPDDAYSFVPIGRPIANVECHVVDEHLRPVPIGQPGELALTGVGLARGYLNRPDLTAERFVADPADPHRRFYRTGDRARWREGGVLEYLGRLDNQVKIRGVRIELGEIESALNSLDRVKAGTAAAQPDAAGGLQLVAYIVPNNGPAPTLSEIRAALSPQLPETFLPTALVLIDHLPLTSSGKLDRRALPAPEAMPIDGFIEARDELEQAIAGIWSDILGRKSIGIFDDFFALGGHSLLATQIVARVRTLLGIDLPLITFFAAPSVAQLADAIRQLERTDDGIARIAPLARREGDLLAHLDELSDDEVEVALRLAMRNGRGHT